MLGFTFRIRGLWAMDFLDTIVGHLLCSRGPGIKYLGNRRRCCVWVSNKPHKQILQFSVLLAVLVALCT